MTTYFQKYFFSQELDTRTWSCSFYFKKVRLSLVLSKIKIRSGFADQYEWFYHTKKLHRTVAVP